MKRFLLALLFASAAFAQGVSISDASNYPMTGGLTLSFGKRMSYVITYLEPGPYRLELTFVEPLYAAAGARLMLVRVNDALWLDGFDVAAAGGYLRPITRSTVAIVGEDGRLEVILTTKGGNNAVLSGLKLRPLLSMD